MANGVIVQFAVLSGFAAILVCLFILNRRRTAHREAVHGAFQSQAVAEVVAEKMTDTLESMPAKLIPITALRSPSETEFLSPRSIATETAVAAEAVQDITAAMSSIAAVPKAPVVVHVQPITNPEDRNQRILAGISENIRKNLVKPVPTYSPLQYPETPRDTEYVRIKKKILTPHGQIRFSILKDSISTNMLAVFRRACMDWKTPNDLISFLPPYLEPEAEILNNQILLIGTPGHNEKLAIPIRSVEAGSSFRDCFDFVTDDRSATNMPAVLLTYDDDDFEIVSRGVITQPVFLSPEERGHSEVKLLAVGAVYDRAQS